MQQQGAATSNKEELTRETAVKAKPSSGVSRRRGSPKKGNMKEIWVRTKKLGTPLYWIRGEIN